MSNSEINVDVVDPVRIVVPQENEEGKTEAGSTIDVVIPLYRFTDLYMKAVTALATGNKKLCNANHSFARHEVNHDPEKSYHLELQEEIDHILFVGRLLVHNVLIGAALDSTKPFSYLPSEVKPSKTDHHSV